MSTARAVDTASRSHEWLSSCGNTNKTAGDLDRTRLNDKSYLTEESSRNFQRGLDFIQRTWYEKAGRKFRISLKARILLQGNANHISIAPVHEMLGHIERKCDRHDKATLHYRAALTILSAEHLRQEHEEERDEGGSAKKISEIQDTQKIVERIEKCIELCDGCVLLDESECKDRGIYGATGHESDAGIVATKTVAIAVVKNINVMSGESVGNSLSIGSSPSLEESEFSTVFVGESKEKVEEFKEDKLDIVTVGTVSEPNNSWESMVLFLCLRNCGSRAPKKRGRKNALPEDFNPIHFKRVIGHFN